MLDTFNRNNYRDFGPRYSHTYGWLVDQKAGTKQLIQITEVEEDRVNFRTDSKQVYHAKLDSNVVFEFIQVQQGWFNSTDGNTYLLSRSPARQWKRGISNSNTHVLILEGMVPTEVSYAIINSIKWGEEGYNSSTGAISKHFAINKQGYLYFYSELIGTVKDRTITLRAGLVQQELTDLIRRKSLPYEVVFNG